jgi:putative endonuclease
MDRQAIGTTAEAVARAHLVARGLTIVQANYRCRLGELDLVCLDGEVLVIAEVRLRSVSRFGNACDSIGWSKRRRIVRATRHLLMKHPELRRYPIRFDVVSFDVSVPGDDAVRWIRGAFDST